MHQAILGDRVRVQYSRVPDRGAPQHKERAPKTCEFTVGGKEVFPGLSLGVVGMAQGDRKLLKLQPQEAYGAVKPELIQQIPRDRFPQNIDLHVGKRLKAMRKIAGQRLRVTVVEITPDLAVVDGNHPLAGKAIKLEVLLISLDSSANANKQTPQFDLGGRG